MFHIDQLRCEALENAGKGEHRLLGNHGCLRREPGARQSSDRQVSLTSYRSSRKENHKIGANRNGNSHNSGKITIEDAIILL